MFEEANAEAIYLIRPPIIFSKNAYSTPIALPIGIAYIAATLLERNIPVKIIDALGLNISQIVLDETNRYKIQGASFEEVVREIKDPPRIFGITMMFSQEWPFVRDFTNKLKEAYPDSIIVIGGEHVSALPEYTLRDCRSIDYVITGEGEESFYQTTLAILENKSPANVLGVCYIDENNNFVANKQNRIKMIDKIPWPAWHLINLEPYFSNYFTMGISHGRNMPMLATRGCPYQCTFCSSPTMWTTVYKTRPVSDVVDELEYYIRRYSISSIDFYDLTAIIQKNWIMEFTAELKKRNIKIPWSLPSGTRSEVLDEDVIRSLKESGMELLVYAPESASENVLKNIKKRISYSKMIKSIRTAKKYGLTVKLNYMIGFPVETRKDILKTIFSVIARAFDGVDDVDLSIFSPYPGSVLFKELLESKEIKKVDDDYFFELMSMYDLFIPKNFCPNVRTAEIMIYRVFSMSVFYIFSYLFYPSRIISFIKSIVIATHHDPRSIFEQRLLDIKARHKLNGKQTE